jgi:O-antigen biosynthesis protein
LISTNNPTNPSPGISVVVCTHNRPVALERCLRMLRKINEPVFSIVVVDSAPITSEAKSVAARYGALYNCSALKGLSRARNIGTRATNAGIVAYLDDDMVPHRRWLESLISEFTDRDVGAATGPVLTLELAEGTDAELQLATDHAPWGPYRLQIDQSSRQWFERTNFGGIGDGNFALRRSAFEQIEGFDERLGRGASIDTSEEHYAYFRLVKSGFKIAYHPKAIVFHPDSPNSLDLFRKRIADSVAFASFLGWNHPLRCWQIAKFLFEGIVRYRRWWHVSSKADAIEMSVRDKIGSGMNGISIFVQSLRRHSKPR